MSSWHDGWVPMRSTLENGGYPSTSTCGIGESVGGASESVALITPGWVHPDAEPAPHGRANTKAAGRLAYRHEEGVSRGKLLVAGQGGSQAEEGQEVRAFPFVSDGEAVVADEPGDRPTEIRTDPPRSVRRGGDHPRCDVGAGLAPRARDGPDQEAR